MQKKVRNILFLIGIIFFCSISNIKAKEVEKMCRYKTPDKMQEDLKMNALCNIYDDSSYKCYFEIGDAEANNNSKLGSIGNWDDGDSFKFYVTSAYLAFGEDKEGDSFTMLGHYNSTKECPLYLTTYLYGSDYMSYAVNSADIVNVIVRYGTYENTKWNILNLYDSSMDAKQQLENIKSSVEVLEGKYDFKGCTKVHMGDENTVKERLENDCIPTVEEQLNLLNDYREELEALIKNGSVKRTDDAVKELKVSMDNVEKYYKEELGKLQNMHKALAAGNDLDFSMKVYEGEYRPVGPDDPNQPIEPGKCALLGDKFGGIVKWAIDLIQIAIPVIIIIMTIIDFSGVVFSGEDKNFKAAGSKFIKRLVIGAIVILLPMLIAFLIDLSGVLVPYGIERDQL